MEKIPIDINEPLNPGDLIELHFSSIGLVWIQAVQVALIEWRLKSRKDFTIVNSEVIDKTRLIFRVRIEKTNPVLITVAVIAGAIAVAGVGIWLTFTGAYKLTPAAQLGSIKEFLADPTGKILAVGGLAVIGALTFGWLKTK